MALLTNVSLGAPAGNQIAYAAASAGGDRVVPGPRVYLLVRNASASSINVTLDSTGVAFNGALIPDTVVAVPAGQDKAIPVTRNYAAALDGRAGITYSATASVTVAAIAA